MEIVSANPRCPPRKFPLPPFAKGVRGISPKGGKHFRKSPKCQSGMTLIDLVLAIVILCVGLTGVMVAFSTVVKSSADPMIHKQMLAIAEEMIEEVSLKSYTPIANGAPKNACARNTFNDIDDYDGYHSDSICDIDGNGVLTGYAVQVTVVTGTLQGVTAAQKITVMVSHGTESFSLVGWRTGYANAVE